MDKNTTPATTVDLYKFAKTKLDEKIKAVKEARAALKAAQAEATKAYNEKRELKAKLKAEHKAAYEAYKKGVAERKAKRAEKRAAAEKAKSEKKAKAKKVVRKPLTKKEADEIIARGEKSLAKFKKAAAKKSPIVKVTTETK